MKRNNGKMTEWRMRLIVVRLLKWKIEKMEGETDNLASLAKEEEVSNCFICTRLG